MSQSLTVLVVDDVPLVRAIATRLLEELGHAVLDTWNGPEALALLDRHPEVDVLVADLRMPGMDGLALSDAARRLRPDLPIVLTSGYVEETPRPDLAFVAKPWQASTIAAAIEAAVARTPGPEGSP